jgi:DNA-binding MarR family transcriptional regulator
VEKQARAGAIDQEGEITLGLLQAVHENDSLTQRSAAQDLGIALGLANAYLKRCVKKGLIKVQQVPPNRYAYYLTPQGFAEKSRLTAEYLSYSFSVFRRARADCEALFEDCVRRERRRVALCGASDVAEIAILCAREFPVEIVGLVDRAYREAGESRFHGLPVERYLIELGAVDAAMVTDMKNAQAVFEGLRAQMPEDRVLTPAVLRISRKAAPDARAARTSTESGGPAA